MFGRNIEVYFLCSNRSGPLKIQTSNLSKCRLFSNFIAATKELVSVMKGHTSAVHSLSVHGSGRYTLTSSFDTTILWDLNTFTKKRTLNGAQDVGIQKVHYIFNKNVSSSFFLTSLTPKKIMSWLLHRFCSDHLFLHILDKWFRIWDSPKS